MNAVVQVVLPVFGLMLAGYVAGRTRLIDEGGVRGLSNFVFVVAIPALLFHSMATRTGADGTGAGVAVAYFGGCLVVFAAAMALARLWLRRRLEEQAVIAMNASFSNSVQLGIPLVFAAFGPAGAPPALVIIAFHSVTLLSLATVLVELGLGRGQGAGRALATVLRSLLANPIIVSLVAGAIWGALGWGLPQPLDRFLALLSGAAAPCALFTLGAALVGLSVRGDLAECMAIGALKLFALPAVVWTLGVGLALPPVDTAVATTIAAIPTGANAFILAQRYNLYVARSGSIIVLTTLFSVVTLSVVLALVAPVR
jgi:malonate transporter